MRVNDIEWVDNSVVLWPVILIIHFDLYFRKIIVDTDKEQIQNVVELANTIINKKWKDLLRLFIIMFTL